MESENYYKLNKGKITQKQKLYREKNIDKIKINEKSYYENNKEKIKESRKKHYEKNKKEILLKQKLSRDKEKRNLYQNKKRKENPIFGLKSRISSIYRKSLKNNGYTKKSKSTEILGCSFNDFKQHIESKFESWMNWDNYGLYNGTEGYGWDIDHIIPLSTAKTEDDVIKLNHYTNLQPLCSFYNRYVKKDNILL